MSEQEARERDSLFGTSSRRSAVTSRAPTGHDRPFQESSESGGGGGGDLNVASAASWGGMTAPQPQQQQGEQLSWAQIRDRLNVAERQRGLRSTYESVEVGRETLECLEDQKEKLDRSEMMLDSTRYAIERSARVLRGMTFWGRIKNAFSDDPQIPQSYRNYRTEETAVAVDEDAPVEGFICPECMRGFASPDALLGHFGSEYGGCDSGAGANGDAGERRMVEAPVATAEERAAATSARRNDARAGDANRRQGDAADDNTTASGSLRDQLFGGRAGAEIGAATFNGGRTGAAGVGGSGGERSVIAEQRAVMSAQDKYLDSVSQAVSELGLLGQNIGASLDAQAGTLDRVAEKTEEADDRAAFVTRKAARQAQSSKPKKPTFVMSLALQEVSSGQFLTVIGEDVVLQETELRNVCHFEAWQRQEGIVGFKSGVTRRWLGQTWLGHLRISGSSFGRTYEWQANLMRRETTLVCCSANWGAGGYLSVRPGGGKDGYTPASAASEVARNRDGASGTAMSNFSAPREPITAGSAGGYSSAFPRAYDRLELTLVDATPANRPRAAVFRVVNCDDYTPQPFVGGRLMRNPTRPDGRQGGGGDVGGVKGEKER